MSAGDTSYWSDVSYDGGFQDSTLDYSGSSTLQDVIPGSPLALDTTGGVNENSSVYDFLFGSDPTASLNLSGVSDPPFGSLWESTPNPTSQPSSDNTWAAITALSKLGSSVATLFGNHTQTISPAYNAGAVPYRSPVGSTSTQTVLLMLIVGGVLVYLLSKGGKESGI